MKNLGLDFELNKLYFTVHSTLVVKKIKKIKKIYISGCIRKRNTNYLDKILMQCNFFMPISFNIHRPVDVVLLY